MTQDKIRNIAIIAHVDHGKTTLVDQMDDFFTNTYAGIKTGRYLIIWIQVVINRWVMFYLRVR